MITKLRHSLKRKAAGITLLLALVLTLTAVTISYEVYVDTMNSHYRMLTMNVAQTAAGVVNKGTVARYAKLFGEIYTNNPTPDLTDPQKAAAYFEQYEVLLEEDYQALFSSVETVKEANDVLSLYLVRLDPASKSAVYLLDGDSSENGCKPGTWDVVYPQNYAALETPEKSFPSYISETEDFGWLCSAGAAITDENGQVIAHAMVDISMEKIMMERYKYFLRLCLFMLLVTAVLIFFFLRMVNRTVVEPINALANAAEGYLADQENFQQRVSPLTQLSIHTGDEVENLCKSIQQMERDINSYIKNLTAVTVEKERIGAELDVARHIQASMLPCIFPPFPECPEVDIYASMTPAKEVGGDFYDFFMVDKTHLALVMADVSGKGVPAALFMIIAKILIKNAVQDGLNAQEVLERVNNQLCENNRAEMFVTAWLGILEVSTGRMQCANAGHEYPVLKKASGDFALIKDRHGLVLAAYENMKYHAYDLFLEPGDLLYLYTDGVTEATDEENQLYGTQQLLTALNCEKNISCQAVLEAVKNDINRFVGDAPQFDDITMLALELLVTPPDFGITKKFAPRLESVADACGFVEDTLNDAGIMGKISIQTIVAVDEIVSNIARYSGATELSVACTVTEKEVVVQFTDDGAPYDPTKKDDPNITLDAEQREVGGLGIFMVKKTMDKVFYENKEQKNILTIKKRREPPKKE